MKPKRKHEREKNMKHILNINGTFYAFTEDGVKCLDEVTDEFFYGEMGNSIELVALFEDMKIKEVADLIGYDYEAGKFIDNQ